MRSLEVYLKRMVEICNDIQTYISGYTHEQFSKDKKTRDAVILMVVQLGEIANLISKQYPEFKGLKTSEIKKARDILVHHYHKVDIERVWSMATYYVPQVVEFLEIQLRSWNQK